MKPEIRLENLKKISATLSTNLSNKFCIILFRKTFLHSFFSSIKKEVQNEKKTKRVLDQIASLIAFLIGYR